MQAELEAEADALQALKYEPLSLIQTLNQ